MSAASSWFDSDDAVVHELRRGAPVAPRTPSIAGYEDLRELRRGGQGIVYLATQASTRRRVAIKVVLDGALAGGDSRRRFEREIELIAGLRHPHIVRVYDSGVTVDGRLYYIMDYIEGAGLDEWIAARFAPPGGDASHGSAAARSGAATGDTRAALAMFAKICDAVQHAHQHGVIHRDLKPSNVRIDGGGEPHVLDFGLAKSVGMDETRMTRTGNFMGSLPWASPEQAEGSPGRIDVRSDVYSLGVMLCQALTGGFPYGVTGSLRQVLDNILKEPPAPPRDGGLALADDLWTIALRCLAKEPPRRYQSAGEIARDIRRHLAGEPIEAQRESAWYALRHSLNRYRTAVRVGAVLLAISVMAGAAMAWLYARTRAAEQLAGQRLQEVESQVARNRQVRDFLDTTLRSVDPWKHPGRDLGPFREMLDAAVRRLEGAFPDQPEVEAALAGTLGWDYGTLGLYDAAESLLRRSWELRRATLGDDDRETRGVLNDLAMLLTEQGKYAESAELFRRLLEQQRRTLGDAHAETLTTMNNLGLALDWRGDSAEAETWFRGALKEQTRLLGPDAPDRLDTLNNLALCIAQLGKTDEAEALLLELVQRRSARGPNRPEALQARMNYAQFVVQIGNLEEGERLLRESRAAIESALGAGHPLTITVLHNLAQVVSDRGRVDEGLALARAALEAQIAFSGPDHARTLARRNSFVTKLIELKRWDEAIPAARELAERFARAFGEADASTLTVRGNLAFALKQLGRFDEAEALFRKVLSMAGSKGGPMLTPVLTGHANLGAIYADTGRHAQAETQYRAALATAEKLSEHRHWRTAFIQAGLGRVLMETGRLDQAEAELSQAVDVLRANLGDAHERTRQALQWLVQLYERKHDAQSAERYRALITPEAESATHQGHPAAPQPAAIASP